MKMLNKTQIKIVFIIHRFNMGGTEKRLIDLLKGLPRDKFELVFLCLYQIGVLENEVKALGVKTVMFGLERVNKVISILKILKFLKRERPDIVHTFLFPSYLCGGIAAILARIPIILSSEENLLLRKTKSHRFIDFCFSLFNSCTVAVSETVKNNLIEKSHIKPDKVKVIYAGLDFDRLQSFRDSKEVLHQLQIKDTDFVVGTMSRLVTQKGHCYLIHAANLVIKENRNVIFVIIGDGHMKEALLKMVKELNIAENFRFLGTRLDSSDLLKIMDIFVFPSLWEGFPLALAEAMYQGKAIVASDIPQLREMIVDDTVGILVPPKDSEILAEAINRLISNVELRESLGNNARSYAISNLCLDRMVKDYKELYIQLFEKYAVSLN